MHRRLTDDAGEVRPSDPRGFAGLQRVAGLAGRESGRRRAVGQSRADRGAETGQHDGDQECGLHRVGSRTAINRNANHPTLWLFRGAIFDRDQWRVNFYREPIEVTPDCIRVSAAWPQSCDRRSRTPAFKIMSPRCVNGSAATRNGGAYSAWCAPSSAKRDDDALLSLAATMAPSTAAIGTSTTKL